uniref:Transmembrane protein n=1 Tax=Romanomermis culicivorax TaxID=13658 RepID=A0A915J4I8_ROMCU
MIGYGCSGGGWGLQWINIDSQMMIYKFMFVKAASTHLQNKFQHMIQRRKFIKIICGNIYFSTLYTWIYVVLSVALIENNMNAIKCHKSMICMCSCKETQSSSTLTCQR